MPRAVSRGRKRLIEDGKAARHVACADRAASANGKPLKRRP
jgi:hypothetical protein